MCYVWFCRSRGNRPFRMYGPDAFCKLLVRDVETVCMHVSGLPDGRSPKHARSLDEIRAPDP